MNLIWLPLTMFAARCVYAIMTGDLSMIVDDPSPF